MRTFRKQLIECVDNGTCIRKKLDEPETIYAFMPISKAPIIITEICWCKKFNMQCKSDTCKLFREKHV